MEPVSSKRLQGRARREVSVVIPCRDDTYLEATLCSLAGQEGAPPFEVVVVDDSPGGNLADRVMAWSDRLDLRLVQAKQRGTPGGNRNVGVAASQCDVLLFVDADDTVGPTYVAAMARALESHDLVCARIDVALLNPPNLVGPHPQETGLITEDLAFLPFASAGTLGIRRSVFKQIGGFDPSLPRYAEADLCWKIQLAGGDPPEFVQDAVSHHRVERRPTKRLRKAAAYGATEALLFSRYRDAGMLRQSPRDAAAAWGKLPWLLIRRGLGHEVPGLAWRLGARVGRLQGSVRHRVAYF
jgi:glycosyltransferase involved in cell wall biosynthesis